MPPEQFVRVLHALSNGLLVVAALAPDLISADGRLRAERFGALTRSHRAEARAELRRERRRMAERVGFASTPERDAE